MESEEWYGVRRDVLVEVETDKFFSGESKTWIMKKLLVSLDQSIFIEENREYIGVRPQINNPKFRKVRERQHQIMGASIDSFYEQYRLESSKGSEYYRPKYFQPVVIEQKASEYEFLWMLKLSHFQNNYEEVVDFIQYQVKNTFKGDLEKASTFIKKNVRQYTDLLITREFKEHVIHVLDSLIDKNQKTPLFFKGDYKTFYNRANTIPVNLTISQVAAIVKLKIGLEKIGLLGNKTSLENFKSLFVFKDIKPKNRIQITSGLPLLRVFTKALEEFGVIEKYMDTSDEALKTSHCFLNMEGKEIDPHQYKIRSLAKNNKANLIRKAVQEFALAVKS